MTTRRRPYVPVTIPDIENHMVRPHADDDPDEDCTCYEDERDPRCPVHREPDHTEGYDIDRQKEIDDGKEAG